MAEFRIISQPNCKWCDRAKALLAEHGYTAKEERLITMQDKAMFRASGFSTVPQVFHGARHIGGFEALDQYLQPEETQ